MGGENQSNANEALSEAPGERAAASQLRFSLFEQRRGKAAPCLVNIPDIPLQGGRKIPEQTLILASTHSLQREPSLKDHSGDVLRKVYGCLPLQVAIVTAPTKTPAPSWEPDFLHPHHPVGRVGQWAGLAPGAPGLPCRLHVDS